MTAPRVLLYTGHLVDAPNATTPRLPAGQVPALQRLIQQHVEAAAAQGCNHAVGSLAAGADLLFAHAALAHGMRLHAFLPFCEADFLPVSVTFASPQPAGYDWLALYRAALAHSATSAHIPADAFTANQQFAQCNTQMLAHALALAGGAAHLWALCAYRPGGAHATGGTGHFLETLQQAGVHSNVFWFE